MKIPAKVFKNPIKAFPDFAKEFTTKVNASLELMASLHKTPNLKAAGAIDLDSKVVTLREKLNQESARMEMVMKSNFLAFNAKPCDETVGKQYFELLKLMAEKNLELEKLRAGLTQPASKGGDTANLVLETDAVRIQSALERFSSSYRFSR